MVFSRHPVGKPCFEYRFAIPVPNDAGEFASLGVHDRRGTRGVPTKIYSIFRTRKPRTPKLMDFVVAICLRVFVDVVILHLIAVVCRTRILRTHSRNVNPYGHEADASGPLIRYFQCREFVMVLTTPQTTPPSPAQNRATPPDPSGEPYPRKASRRRPPGECLRAYWMGTAPL